ncbi:hypothetical protein GWI33_016436 [Rhynchophorus ferrugineus]|uniref:Uncharacterized protein n=1 Tax=Rhynchophorus ferrugineus TaxID=354439 RepID=A0A834I3L7_RHYFE|nr:hypothetical protein GWI33_016436 [Rhynchophorus ferrugineus]
MFLSEVNSYFYHGTVRRGVSKQPRTRKEIGSSPASDASHPQCVIKIDINGTIIRNLSSCRQPISAVSASETDKRRFATSGSHVQ